MVDAIGSRPIATALPATTASQRVERTPARRDETVATRHDLSALALGYDAATPVDEAHVEEVRRAIRNGTYPVLPETIADRLLALKLNWTPKK